jgi:predicted phosphodiesterase
MAHRKVRIVCISDTHNASPGEGYTLPRGDILIYAGDLTNSGQPSEIRKALAWLRGADYENKIVVAGNHDISLDEHFPNQHEEAAEIRQTTTLLISSMRAQSLRSKARRSNSSARHTRLHLLKSNGRFNTLQTKPNSYGPAYLPTLQFS